MRVNLILYGRPDEKGVRCKLEIQYENQFVKENKIIEKLSKIKNPYKVNDELGITIFFMNHENFEQIAEILGSEYSTCMNKLVEFKKNNYIEPDFVKKFAFGSNNEIWPFYCREEDTTKKALAHILIHGKIVFYKKKLDIINKDSENPIFCSSIMPNIVVPTIINPYNDEFFDFLALNNIEFSNFKNVIIQRDLALRVISSMDGNYAFRQRSFQMFRDLSLEIIKENCSYARESDEFNKTCRKCDDIIFAQNADEKELKRFLVKSFWTAI